MSELVIFPGIHGKRGKRDGGAILLRIILGPEDIKLLDKFRAPHGISRDDAAGRVVRHGLRSHAHQSQPLEPYRKFSEKFSDEEGGGDAA